MLGYEAHALSVHDRERFAQAGKAWRWMATTDLVERLRCAKTTAKWRPSGAPPQLAGEGLRLTLAQVQPGMTELAIAGVSRACAVWARGPSLRDHCGIGTAQRAASRALERRAVAAGEVAAC